MSQEKPWQLRPWSQQEPPQSHQTPLLKLQQREQEHQRQQNLQPLLKKYQKLQEVHQQRQRRRGTGSDGSTASIRLPVGMADPPPPILDGAWPLGVKVHQLKSHNATTDITTAGVSNWLHQLIKH